MLDDFPIALEKLIRRAPATWLDGVCENLLRVPSKATAEFVLDLSPASSNSDLSFLLREVVRTAAGQMTWEALSWTIRTTAISYRRWKDEQQIEFLWSGPSPANQIPARRIDQALYDLIADARIEILLITFAAAKIERLTRALLNAVQTGVRIRLLLEFEQSSEGQLSYDAVRAFPSQLVAAVEVFHWPMHKRERNQAGRLGKLHAKVAIVDDTVLVSSANLTDDAFRRNLEIGIMTNSPEFVMKTRSYINSLIAAGTICPLLP